MNDSFYDPRAKDDEIKLISDENGYVYVRYIFGIVVFDSGEIWCFNRIDRAADRLYERYFNEINKRSGTGVIKVYNNEIAARNNRERIIFFHKGKMLSIVDGTLNGEHYLIKCPDNLEDFIEANYLDNCEIKCHKWERIDTDGNPKALTIVNDENRELIDDFRNYVSSLFEHNKLLSILREGSVTIDYPNMDKLVRIDEKTANEIITFGINNAHIHIYSYRDLRKV
jgi:hypothetical protein